MRAEFSSKCCFADMKPNISQFTLLSTENPIVFNYFRLALLSLLFVSPTIQHCFLLCVVGQKSRNVNQYNFSAVRSHFILWAAQLLSSSLCYRH